MDYSYEILLQKVRENPHKYLAENKLGSSPSIYSGEKSLFRLRLFMTGYYYRCLTEEWEKETGLKAYEHFEEANAYENTPESIIRLSGKVTFDFNYFVHDHYDRLTCSEHTGGKKILASPYSPESLIKEMSSSEEEAFDKYFELRDAFIAQRGEEKRAYPSI
jgi:hypothetical protein